MVPVHGPSQEVTPVPTDSTTAALAAVRSGDCRVRVRADRELDRGVGAADAGQPRDRPGATDLRRAHPRRRVHDRGATRAPLRRTCGPSPRSPSQAHRCATGWPPTCPKAAADTGQLQRCGRRRRRRRPCRRRREYRAGGRAVRPGRAGVRRRRRTQRQDPVRVGRAAGPAAAEHRRGPDVGGLATRQRPRCAGFGADRVRDPRHRPDPYRIPAYPKGVGHLHLLPRLRRAHRRRRRRRGTQGASPSLRRCAISGVMADGIGRGGGAAAIGRAIAVVDEIERGQAGIER